MADYGRVLVVGGTGMLAQACRSLAPLSGQMILAARHPEALAQELGAVPWAMDWRDQCSGLSALVPMPEFDLVVAWLHQDGLWLAEHLQSKVAAGGRFVHIHPSIAENPELLAKRAVPARSGIATQNVVLGRVDESGHKRWMRPEEISARVIAALKTPVPAS